jgi:hypothetical protein
MTAYRARCNRSFTGEFELAGEQMLEALVVHDQHDQVHAFNSDLQSPTSTAYRHERGCAPAFGGTASRHAASVLATKDESTFDQVWYDEDALCIAQHFFRDAFVWGRHDGVQNIDGGVQACD